MANTKGKIIIGTGIVLVGGVSLWMILDSFKKKKIKSSIFKILNDTSLIGSQGAVGSDEAHKYTLALDPNFWQKTKGTPLPTKLIPDRSARDIAKKIYDNIGSAVGWDNEGNIMAQIKKLKTQGQMSQVAFVYSNAPLNYGNLGDDLQKALEGGVLTKDRLQELNLYINSLPY